MQRLTDHYFDNQDDLKVSAEITVYSKAVPIYEEGIQKFVPHYNWSIMVNFVDS